MVETTIKRTVGIQRADGLKDYQIETDCGQSYLAIRRGAKWVCNGSLFASVRDVKSWITNRVDMTDEEELNEKADFPELKKGQQGTYDCVDPIHLLALVGDSVVGLDIQLAVSQTLDCYGLLTKDGEIDTTLAKRELEEWRQRCPGEKS